ncbi:MAG TPA: fasciclin domain-containing protein [Bacteroidales bacterium]|jgi:uncharacterized surface protein with fasciclin (FAS1) repeats|nr:fasciclin domain-containing protein [Bacteroidales bacterium]
MKRATANITFLSLMLALFSGLISGCREEIIPEAFFEEDELLISAYLEQHSDEFSTLIRVLEITELKNTLNAYGHYTFFAPDNKAFENFCTRSGKSSVEEFDKEYLTTLIKYHLIGVETESSYFRNGALKDTTYSGDYLVITFSEGGLESIHVNEALITERDIPVGNGFIHKIDAVCAPIVGSVMDRLNESDDLTIFTEALELSGLSDSLNTVIISFNEDMVFRSRFTLFAELDEVYIQNGINSAADLIARYSDSGDPTDKENGFYKYMAYHIVPGLYYLNEIDSFNYPTLAKNMLINVQLQSDVYLNRHTDTEGEKIITVNESTSNRQAKNGVIHCIDKILEPYVPEPVYLIIDLTDYQGITLGHIYDERELEDMQGITVRNTGIYFRNSILGDGETNLQTTSGKVGWTVEFEIPPIRHGQYDIYLHWASHQEHCQWVQAFWDGGRLGNPFSFVQSKRWPGVEWKYDFNTSQWLGRVLLNETSSHILKFIALESGYGNFDYMVLIPAEN